MSAANKSWPRHRRLCCMKSTCATRGHSSPSVGRVGGHSSLLLGGSRVSKSRQQRLMITVNVDREARPALVVVIDACVGSRACRSCPWCCGGGSAQTCLFGGVLFATLVLRKMWTGHGRCSVHKVSGIASCLSWCQRDAASAWPMMISADRYEVQMN